MNINIFDKISDINIRNIQYNYDFKSNILSKNSISIETDKPICKYIIGKTKILDKLNETKLFTTQLNLLKLQQNIIGGLVGAYISHPLDTIKTRIQSKQKIKKYKCLGIVSTSHFLHG